MTAPARPRVLVVGAGIGGLTLAAVLTRLGIPCEVYERAERLTEAGAGLQLAPNAVRPLLRLGLGPALREHGVRFAASEVRGRRDEPIARTELGDDCERRFAAPCYGMHRRHLHAALRAAAGRAPLRLGHRVVGVEDHGEGARVVFADGSDRWADLVVGADGIRSVVRGSLADDAPVFAGFGAYRALVPAERLPRAAREPVVRVWMGPGRHLVSYPVAGGGLVGFAAILPLDAPPADPVAEPGGLRAAFTGWRGLVPDLLGAADTVRVWALQDREPLARWATGRVTVLGDAAHPMLPFLAQGANQAVEDAVELAAALVMCGGDVPAALTCYEAARSPRTTAIQRRAREHAAALHLPDGPGRRARDAALGRTPGLDDRAWLYGHRAGVVRVPA
ncbi:3-hydroxybenzoate 6-hydroxylase 1 [Streptomyces sp. RB5]|uniref:3-hydroxybenzoate 6-hydroxylase 1 n=1 Tax=Streptomyces smaragdinus TaxID=2585196 RepID=A0A7K0CG94_9ACTN|nr:FAD-dependent monooxygenase [Streptomyces smaragdinus]MQY12495.1 3-hydroxybenzoate 6-hydroxylase 1 [Streptomyces smaragdinus]